MTILFVVLTTVVAAPDDSFVVGAFSQNTLDGWDTKSFSGQTVYELIDMDGRRVLQARSQAAASGLYKRVRIDLERTPYLHWSWRVDHTLGAVDETSKSGDDYAARVYVVFSGGLFFWNTRALNYVWANRQPRGGTWPNAFTANAEMVAVRSGDTEIGQWRSERRDVRADFRRAFGRNARYVDAVAIMTDTDNTGLQADAWYGDIYFSSR